MNSNIPVKLSKLRQIAATANANTINLTIGNPIDLFPKELENLVMEKSDFPLGYSPNPGNPKLRELIAKKYNFDPSECLIVNGAQGGLMTAFMAIMESGKSKLAYPDPGFLAYPTMGGILGCESCTYRFDQVKGEFQLSVDSLISQVPDDCDVVLLNSPANPSNHVFTKEELKELADWAEGRGKYLVLDEVYGELNYSESYQPSFYKSDHVVTVSSLSKSHALAGIRIGWAFTTNQELLAKMTVVHQYYNTCAASLSQKVAYELFKREDLYQELRSKYRRIYQHKLNVFFNKLNFKRVPKSAFYAFLNIGENSEQFCKELLAKENILLVPGAYFGAEGEGYVRASLAVSDEDLVKAAAVLKKYLI